MIKSTRLSRTTYFLSAMAMWCLAACGNDSTTKLPTNPQVPVAHVTMTVPVGVSIVGFGLQLSAQMLDASGAVLTGRTVSWVSSDVNTATVSSSGLVTGVAEGNVRITATSEGQSAFADLQVIAIHVQAVSLTAPSTTMNTGSAQQLVAQTLSSTGLPLPNRPVTWSSSDNSKATVSPNGVVTAIAAGSVTITAECEGKSATAVIAVVP